nr:hypothetical protein [Tanacetum cinerariifolium]
MEMTVMIQELAIEGQSELLGSVMASKPKIIQDAIEFATKLMNQKIRTFANHQAENKRKLDDNSRNNQNQQQPFKRQNVARANTAGPREKKLYGEFTMGSVLPSAPTVEFQTDLIPGVALVARALSISSVRDERIYPEVHPSFQISDEVFHAKSDLMKSIQTFLEEFNYIPFGEKPKILLEAWDKFFTIQLAQLEDSNELFQKLLEDLKKLAEYKDSLENSSKVIDASNSNKEKEGPSQDSDIRQLIRKECCIEVCEEQKQNMENTILELVEICRQKELICIHDNVDDLIESAFNSKLLSINSQRLDKEKQEVKNVVEQSAERRTHEIIKSGVEELVPILSENEVTSKDKRDCDVPISKNSPICNNHSKIFFDSKNDDDISSDDNDFEDIEYVEASLPDPEIVRVEEENVVHQEEEEVDLEDVFQIQDMVLREKLLSITRLIANIKSLNDNPTPDRVLNSFESDNSLSDNFSPEFKTFYDHTEETRSGNTTTHADDSLLEYDSFCFKIEPDQERLINVMKNDISDNSSNDPLLKEVDLFLSDNLIPPGIENFADDSKGDIRFLEALLIYDSILSPESSDSSFEDNPSIPRPPPEPPDAEFDAGEEIPVVMNDKDEIDDYSSLMFIIYSKMFLSFLSAKSEDTIFDPGISGKDCAQTGKNQSKSGNINTRLEVNDKSRINKPFSQIIKQFKRQRFKVQGPFLPIDQKLEEPIEDQPLPVDASPTALSPGNIDDFDPEEDEEDPEEDPADYPAVGGDNDYNESSDDDNDDDDWSS